MPGCGSISFSRAICRTRRDRRFSDWIRDGQVGVSHGKAKPALEVTPGLVASVSPPAAAPSIPTAEALPLRLLYDDDDIAVVDKPAGMVVHPAAGHPRGTLVNALLHHLGEPERRRQAPNVRASFIGSIAGRRASWSSPATTARTAISRGSFTIGPSARSTWRSCGARRPWGRRSRARSGATSGTDRRCRPRSRRARAALTEILDVEPLGGVSLVRLRIGTGRTHQIRVHLGEAGHSVVGDALYGGDRAARSRPTRAGRPTGPARSFTRRG